MADYSISISISDDVVNSVNQLSGSLTALQNATKGALENLDNLTSSSEESKKKQINQTDVVKHSTGAWTGFSNALKNIPNGFASVLGSVSPIIDSFALLKATTGSTGSAFKSLFSGLLGAGGISLAFNLVSAAITVIPSLFTSAKEKAVGLTSSFNELSLAGKNVENSIRNMSTSLVSTEEAMTSLKKIRQGTEDLTKESASKMVANFTFNKKSGFFTDLNSTFATKINKLKELADEVQNIKEDIQQAINNSAGGANSGTGLGELQAQLTEAKQNLEEYTKTLTKNNTLAAGLYNSKQFQSLAKAYDNLGQKVNTYTLLIGIAGKETAKTLINSVPTYKAITSQVNVAGIASTRKTIKRQKRDWEGFYTWMRQAHNKLYLTDSQRTYAQYVQEVKAKYKSIGYYAEVANNKLFISKQKHIAKSLAAEESAASYQLLIAQQANTKKKLLEMENSGQGSSEEAEKLKKDLSFYDKQIKALDNFEKRKFQLSKRNAVGQGKDTVEDNLKKISQIKAEQDYSLSFFLQIDNEEAFNAKLKGLQERLVEQQKIMKNATSSQAEKDDAQSNIDSIQSQINVMNAQSEASKNMSSMMNSSFSAIKSGMKDAAKAAISGSSSIGAALKSMTQQVVLNLAAEASVQAIMETAKGLACLALSIFDPKAGAAASGHFAAAATFATVGGAAIIASQAIGTGSSSSSSSDSSDSSDSTTTSTTTSTTSTNINIYGNMYEDKLAETEEVLNNTFTQIAGRS